MDLLNYQHDGVEQTHQMWDRGARNVLLVFPTGAGKTFTFTYMVKHLGMRTVLSAHRQELVYQISMSLAAQGINHQIVAAKGLISLCAAGHTAEYGRGFVRPDANVLLGGTRTILARAQQLRFWLSKTQLWIQDEAHHILHKNEFGRLVELMPMHCKGLGVTATPQRADGKGLGAHVDGVFHALVVGPSVAELIKMGRLSKYEIIMDESKIDLSEIKMGASGDYVQKQMQATMLSQKQKYIGRVPEHYLKYAPGELGLTFAPSIKIAHELAEAYRAVGVPAKAISGKTPDAERVKTMKDFRRGELKQLVSVDLFGEGLDVPGTVTGSFVRPTASESLHDQMIGRELRVMEGKEKAYLIDHVGNIAKFGLPDRPRVWSLDRAAKSGGRGPVEDNPTRICPQCMAVYPKVEPSCPYCKYAPEPTERTSPEFVDGDLTLLSEEALQALRAKGAKIDMAAESYRAQLQRQGCPPIGIASNLKKHKQNQDTQTELRNTLNMWLGFELHEGSSKARAFKKFYFKYKLDVLSARGLTEREARELNVKLLEDIDVRE